MIALHFSPGSASMTPHLLLRELGLPFELVRVDTAAGAHRRPEYLKLNPNGLVPVLVDGELVLYETAAIVLHLVDTHPGAGLAPPPGTRERAEFTKWLVWLATTPQAMAKHYFYPERMAAPGSGAVAEVRAAAERAIEGMLDQIDDRLAATGAWMGGQRFGALDPYTFMLCRWTRNMRRPARTLPHVAPFLQRMLARPAVKAVFEAEGLGEPYV